MTAPTSLPELFRARKYAAIGRRIAQQDRPAAIVSFGCFLSMVVTEFILPRAWGYSVGKVLSHAGPNKASITQAFPDAIGYIITWRKHLRHQKRAAKRHCDFRQRDRARNHIQKRARHTHPLWRSR